MSDLRPSEGGNRENYGSKEYTTEVTINDVARLAGVSVSTVSRILNDKPDVAQATRQRVKQVIEELGYSPHALAQRLGGRRSRSIALVFPLTGRIDRGEVATFIIQTALAAERENYLFSLVAAPSAEQRLLNLYRSAQVEGVILMEVHLHDWRVELLKQYDYPFVMIGRCTDNTGLRFIDLDFEKAIEVATDHLVELGHQRIVFLNSGMLRRGGYGPAVRAYQGYEIAREQHHIDILDCEAESIPEVMSILKEMNASAMIVAVHSIPIPELMRAMWQQGYRIPEDLSIVCLQADEIAKNLVRPMTSVSFDVTAAANRAAQMLIDWLEGQSSTIEQAVLPPQLIIRESTAPVA
jgi:DNA-binding LacI/PurR family transcriptional regulator